MFKLLEKIDQMSNRQLVVWYLVIGSFLYTGLSILVLLLSLWFFKVDLLIPAKVMAIYALLSILLINLMTIKSEFGIAVIFVLFLELLVGLVLLAPFVPSFLNFMSKTVSTSLTDFAFTMKIYASVGLLLGGWGVATLYYYASQE